MSKPMENQEQSRLQHQINLLRYRNPSAFEAVDVSSLGNRTYHSPIEYQQRIVCLQYHPHPAEIDDGWRDLDDMEFWSSSRIDAYLLWRRKFTINASPPSVDLDIRLDPCAKFGLTIRQRPSSGNFYFYSIILRGLDGDNWQTELDGNLSKMLSLSVPQGDERFIIGEDEEGINILSFGKDGLQHWRGNEGLETSVSVYRGSG